MKVARHLGTACVVALAMNLASCGNDVWHEPIKNAANRATPLHFGMYVTPDPATNPITPPERFIGFHNAVDYEISQGELNGDVPVYAACKGKVLYSGFAGGYGGLVVHRCTLKGQPVTVLYGHLSLTGLSPQDSTVQPGQVIGMLAPPHSYESDGNRKHLHFGIHKGTVLDFRGYVQTEPELADYIDPLTVFPPETINFPGDSAGEVPYWKVK